MTRWLDFVTAIVTALLSLTNFWLLRDDTGWLKTLGKWIFAVMTVVSGACAVALYDGRQAEIYELLARFARVPVLAWIAFQLYVARHLHHQASMDAVKDVKNEPAPASPYHTRA